MNKGTFISELCIAYHQDKLDWNHLEPRNEAFSPISCLLSKTKTMSLDILIQVEASIIQKRED